MSRGTSDSTGSAGVQPSDHFGCCSGPREQDKGCPESSTPPHPSILTFSPKLLVLTPCLPAASLKASLGFRAYKMGSSEPSPPCPWLGEMRVPSVFVAQGGADRAAQSLSVHRTLRCQTRCSSRSPPGLHSPGPHNAGSQPGLLPHRSGGAAGRGSEAEGSRSRSR